MREVAQRLTGARGVQICGRRAAFSPERQPSVTLRVEVGTGRAFFAGCLRCNSVWECPVCAPRIQAGRAEELTQLNGRHAEKKGSMLLATLTLPHSEGDSLKPLRKHVSRAWGNVTRGAPWERWKKRLGLVGTVRALEVTHGPNGWHPHLHVALYLTAGATREMQGELREWLARQWRRYITERTPEGRSYRAPSVEHGVTVQPLRGSQYLAKMGLAGELALSTTKEGRQGHRTPWQILRDVTLAAYGKGERSDTAGDDRQLWHEYSRAMKGARQLTYSKGLRARYALGEPAPDAELADTQSELETMAAGSSEVVATWSAKEWVEICRLPVGVRLALLQVPRYPRDSWGDLVTRFLDEAKGLPPVPF